MIDVKKKKMKRGLEAKTHRGIEINKKHVMPEHKSAVSLITFLVRHLITKQRNEIPNISDNCAASKLTFRDDVKHVQPFSLFSPFTLPGFTLAEVLITLGIIGVVAAMTIPTLINNSQKSQYVAGLQKSISTLSNGFKQIMTDTGCSDMPCTGIIGADSEATVDNIETAKVFSVIKKCHINQSGCHDKMVSYLNTVQAWVPSANYSMLVLKDGTVMGYSTVLPNCDHIAGNNQYAETCVYHTIIDVNGPKAPNIIGRDVFRFYISKYGNLLPVGAKDATDTWGYWDTIGGYACNSSGTGETCMGRIMEQSWQMNY